ncbi:hypothetical protein EBR96_03180 [bacterium]|nr:hypothetical protein [bacterium]
MPVASPTQSLIRRIIAGNQLANAYLFVGPANTFRRQCARFMAQAIHCTHASESRPCGKCPACERFRNQTEINAIQVTGESNKLTVDTIRTLQDQIKYGPSQNHVMTVEIPNADTMTDTVANAFLKTLEEPAEGITFLICAASEYNVLPTIKSRCQVIHCTPLPPSEIEIELRQSKEEIPQAWLSVPALVIDALESGIKLPTDIPSIFEILNTPIDRRMIFAPALYGQKDCLQLILRRWLAELTENTLANPETYQDLNQRKRIDLLVENINNLRYNLNSRLHIDSLLLSL